MVLQCCSRINRRRAILRMLAAGCIAVMSVEASALPTPDAPNTGKAYVAFFLGQGGYLFSWGVPRLESEARKLGFATDVFSYTDVNSAWASIVRRRREGYKIALVGYSLGNTTATYLQQHLPVDLLLAISESSLGLNHPVSRRNTKRSVLWYGPDALSNAGVHDGFDETRYVANTHLLMDLDPRVVSGVRDELKNLIAPERPEVALERRIEPVVAANARMHKRIVSRAHRRTPTAHARPKQAERRIAAAPAPAQRTGPKIAAAPAPEQWLSANWLPPTNVITPDVTCKKCWGFAQSLSVAGPDHWIE